MSYEYLNCPQCKCPLDPPTGYAARVACPRCNTWVEVDSQCTSNCFSCQKSPKSTTTHTCATSVAFPEAEQGGTISTSAEPTTLHKQAKMRWLSRFQRILGKITEENAIQDLK